MATIEALRGLPNINSTDVQWIEWHKLLKYRYGKKKANSIFLFAFNKRKGAEGVTGSKANTASLREYLKRQDVDISADGSFSFVADTIDDASSFIDGAFGVGKGIFIVIGLLVLIPVAIFLFKIALNPGYVSAAIGGGSTSPPPAPPSPPAPAPHPHQGNGGEND